MCEEVFHLLTSKVPFSFLAFFWGCLVVHLPQNRKSDMPTLRALISTNCMTGDKYEPKLNSCIIPSLASHTWTHSVMLGYISNDKMDIWLWDTMQLIIREWACLPWSSALTYMMHALDVVRFCWSWECQYDSCSKNICSGFMT